MERDPSVVVVSLREEVARRLILAHGAFLNSREAELLPDQAAQAMAWGVVANEAIRIAEWARRERYLQGFKDGRDYEALDTVQAITTVADFEHREINAPPLTLPPVDWRPK